MNRREFLQASGALIVSFRFSAAPFGTARPHSRHAAPQSGRLVARHRGRRKHHRIQRQGRTRPRYFDGADSVGGRRALGALQARQPDLLRYRDHAGSGAYFREPVPSRELQSRQSGPGRGDRSRDAVQAGVGTSERAGGPAPSVRRRHCREERSIQEGRLRGTGSREEIQPHGQYQRQTKATGRVDRPREANAPPRSPGIGYGRIRVCPQRALAWHAARQSGPATGGRRDRNQRGRGFSQGHAGVSEGRGQEELRRRGGAEALAGPSSRRQIEGELDSWHRPAKPRPVLRSTPQ